MSFIFFLAQDTSSINFINKIKLSSSWKIIFLTMKEVQMQLNAFSKVRETAYFLLSKKIKILAQQECQKK